MTDLSASLLAAIAARRADTARLRALAQAATPGPWFDHEGYVESALPMPAEPVAAHCADNDAAFIAACSPDVLLVLLDRLDRADDYAEALIARHEGGHRCDDDALYFAQWTCPEIARLSASLLPPTPTPEDGPAEEAR